MKPNEENAKLPPGERPFRVLIISGSDRRQYNCPGVDSKSRTPMLQMAEMLPQDWKLITRTWAMYMQGPAFKAASPVSPLPWRFVCGPATVMKKTAARSRT